MNIEERIRLNVLLDRYGKTLTPSQLEIMTDYCVYDLSLSEIASAREISRAAVDDSIKKASVKLESMEKNVDLDGLKERLKKALKEGNKEKLEEEIDGI